MIACVTWWVSGGDMNRVITLLVIACPCAIVLATPSAVVAAVAASARLGILIKNIGHLELASKIKAFVFDKTGTLTEGELSVARLKPEQGTEPAALLLAAASAERGSNHPTAKALVSLATEAGLELKTCESFEETHGKGVRASFDGAAYLVGRAAWLSSQGVDTGSITDSEEHDAENAGMSVVYVARDGKPVGWIGFKDKIRNEAHDAIAELKKLGVKHCVMVTGDRKQVADLVAAKLEIECLSECLPDAKVRCVEAVKKDYPVAVVGDGVNDAPALAAGDLGIAMGAIGSDIAINSASIALMTNDLRRIPMFITISKKSSLIINENLMIGLVFVLGGIILSVFGLMSPIAAAFLHSFSTIIILFNSARLVRAGEELTVQVNS
jgi:Cd2+/Zn2+-exporting ATPase